MTNDEARMTNQTAMTKGATAQPRRPRKLAPREHTGGRWTTLRTTCRLPTPRPCVVLPPVYSPGADEPSPGARGAAAAPTSILSRGLLLAAAVLIVGVASGCARGIIAPGGMQARRDVYMHLMTPLQQSKFQYLESTSKPVSILLAYLQEIGVYQQWAEQPKDIQDAILARRVVEGMTPLQVQMAWGMAEERRDETEPAERAAGHTKTTWDYGRRTQRVGGSSYDRSVCFLDDRVLWVRRTR